MSLFNFKPKTTNVRLEGCLDETRDYIQHCKHGIRTDAHCSKCIKEKSETSEPENDSFNLSIFKNV